MKNQALLAAAIALTALSATAQKSSPAHGKVSSGPAAKIASELRSLNAEIQSGVSASKALKSTTSWAARDGGRKVQIIVSVKQFSPELTAAVTGAGLEIISEATLPGDVRHIVVLASDLSKLETLAARPDVIQIMAEPMAALRVGAASNQADASIRAALARSTTGFNGAGIRVGVLSDTFHRRAGGGTLVGGILTGAASQTSGDLPPTVRIIDPGPVSGSDEGAGMAELIYDLAPGVAMSFASAFTSYSGFANNITALRTDPGFNCNVIVDDVYYFVEPLYQNGPIAIAANAANAAGVPYFSSAGNDADEAHESVLTDLNVASEALALPAGADFHDFGLSKGAASDKYLSISLPNGAQAIGTLRWDEPYGGGLAAGPGAESDLDLYLVNNTVLPLTSGGGGNIVNTSGGANGQGQVGSPAGDAVEFISYVNNTGVTQNLHFVVDHYWGRPAVNMHLAVSLSNGSILDKPLCSDRTIFGHSAASGAVSVAAMFYGEIDFAGNVDAPAGQLDVEAFSSKGGNLPYWFPDSGTPRNPLPTFVFKPDITAPDGTNTTFFGQEIAFDPDAFPNFFGTSAAAPHAAAVAALMLDAKPTLSPAQVLSILKSTAREAEAAGIDNLAGWGLIDAKDAVDQAIISSINDWQLYR